MMAADYRHIGGVENRLGRHYSRFSPFWPAASFADQSLALRKSWNAGSNRRSQVKEAGLGRWKSCRGTVDPMTASTSSWCRRLRLARNLCGLPVEAEAAGAEGDDVKEPAGHHQVLVEMDHVVLISGRQMHPKSGAQADKGQQSSGPSAIETREQREAAEQMDRDRDPDRDIGRGYVNAGE